MLPYIHAIAIVVFAITTLDWLIFVVKNAPKTATFPFHYWLVGWWAGALELGYWLSKWT